MIINKKARTAAIEPQGKRLAEASALGSVFLPDRETRAATV
jgi:hypothetical protein